MSWNTYEENKALIGKCLTQNYTVSMKNFQKLLLSHGITLEMKGECNI